MLIIARLQMRQVLAGPRRWLLLATLCAPIGLIAVIAFGSEIRSAREFEVAAGSLLFLFYPIGVAVMAALLYGTSILGAEVQNQTLTYLFTRSTPRWRIVVGKYLANVALLAVGAVASLFVSWLLLTAGELRLLTAIAAAVAMATLAYNATFTLLGSIFTRKTLLAGTIYAIVAELVPAVVPANAREFTIMYYTRCLALNLSGIADQAPTELRRWIGDASTETSLLVLTGITIGALVLASRITTNREFALTDEP